MEYILFQMFSSNFDPNWALPFKCWSNLGALSSNIVHTLDPLITSERSIIVYLGRSSIKANFYSGQSTVGFHTQRLP